VLPVYAVAAGAAVWAVLRLVGPVRRRALVIGVPIVVSSVVSGTVRLPILDDEFPVSRSGPPAWQWVLVVGAPIVAFGVALAILRRFECNREPIARGRRAEPGEAA
jgi:energy-converting hydrogenase Eha subunit A